MSIVKKAYSTSQKIKEFTGRKTFKVSFMVFLTFLLFFGTYNIYAQEDEGISPDWEGTKTFHNAISGADPEEDNVTSRQGIETLNAGWVAVSLIAPDIASVEVSSNLDIPYDLRRGLLGLMDDAGNAAYAMYPTINVPDHLARMWVPGYEERTVGIYAADSHPSGYEELTKSGIVPLWTQVLNLSYIFFVLVMLVAGFMIMFRHKIGGQAMVTLGTVLPKVIIALILATFSFAIAGFIIDIGGVISGMAAYVLNLGDEIVPIAYWGDLMKAVLSGGLGLTAGIGATISGVLTTVGLAGGLAGSVGLVAMFSNPTGWAVAAAVGALGLILILAVLGVIAVGAFKVLITLYKAFFNILLGVILGPMQITLGAIPGNSHMMKNWAFGLIRNVLVFPLVLFIVNLPSAIAASGGELMLRFPGVLVGEDPTTYNSATGFDAASGIFLTILRIVVLYFAAQAPKYLEAWFPAATPEAVAKGIGSAQASMSKIPLIGSLFK